MIVILLMLFLVLELVLVLCWCCVGWVQKVQNFKWLETQSLDFDLFSETWLVAQLDFFEQRNVA